MAFWFTDDVELLQKQLREAVHYDLSASRTSKLNFNNPTQREIAAAESERTSNSEMTT
jgi:hypothetical protein